MRLILNWLISAIVVLVLSYILPNVHVDGFMTALVLAVVLSLLNMIVKPILVVLTIPITILTLGLFLLVINAIIIYLADYIVPGFEVNGILWAIIFSLLLSLINSIFQTE